MSNLLLQNALNCEKTFLMSVLLKKDPQKKFAGQGGEQKVLHFSVALLKI